MFSRQFKPINGHAPLLAGPSLCLALQERIGEKVATSEWAAPVVEAPAVKAAKRKWSHGLPLRRMP